MVVSWQKKRKVSGEAEFNEFKKYKIQISGHNDHLYK